MKKSITYIFPIYNEEGNIDILFKTMLSTVKPVRSRYEFEFVFINDGSRDDSLNKLLAIQKKHVEVTVINLSRNFGHQIAVTAGINAAQGDAVIIMDSDMQDPPEVSIDLVKKWEEGYDVVYAQRRSRQDTLFKRLTASVFYRLLHKLSDIDIPRNTGDFRLIDKRVADSLNLFGEHNRFLRGLVSYVGFKQTAVQFDRHERLSGETGYPLKKMLKFAGDGIMGFSTAPLQLITRLGYAFSALSLAGILYAIAMKFLRPDITVEGWTLMIVAVLLIGGVQLIMLGVVGGYIGRIYTEVQNRPLYIVESIHRQDKRTSK